MKHDWKDAPVWKQWLACYEEFGDRAHERFVENHLVANEIVPVFFSTNESLLSMSDFRLLYLKPLPDLFAHDVSLYGDNAYLMWEVSSQWVLAFNFSFNNNFTVECALTDDRSLVKRKQSAALPFDLDRAISGDKVQITDLPSLNLIDAVFLGCSNDGYAVCVKWGNNGNLEIIEKRYFEQELRMKFPDKMFDETTEHNNAISLDNKIG